MLMSDEEKDEEKGDAKGDAKDDFWRPLWKRAGVIVLGIVWAVIEARRGSILWPALAGLLVAMASWEFFLSGHYDKK